MKLLPVAGVLCCVGPTVSSLCPDAGSKKAITYSQNTDPTAPLDEAMGGYDAARPPREIHRMDVLRYRA